ncbi:MAG: LCP family protein [Chloroflexi bacterium]|nr:LCP family protein [Chloroflexota bacterium]
MTQTQQPPYSDRPSRRSTVISGTILALLLVIFLSAFGYASYLFFQTARTIALNAPQRVSAQRPAIATDNSEGLVNVKAGSHVGQSMNAGNVDSSISDLLAPVWNVQEPINILLLGIDQRLGQKGYYRTDTMILMNIDPRTGNVGLLSMPRDLWVMIPGFEEDRINTAHVIGDLHKYPGGGPVLAKETVAQLVGQPVHYYVRINFQGFRTLLEEIGCIDITVPFTIDDPEFPDDNFGFDPFYLEAGEHCMDADTALKYARTRHIDSDFGRMKRQQQVIVAVKDKVLSAGQLLYLSSRMPALLNTFSDSLQTDMPINQQITLTNMARKLNTDHIRSMVIDRSMTTPRIQDSGAYTLLPNMDVMRPALKAFFDPEAGPAPEQHDSLQQELAGDNARIAVLNGTDNPDLAREVAEWLTLQGYIIAGYGEADHSNYLQTQIIDYSSKTLTMQALLELFAVADENIQPGAGDPNQADIRLILGADFRPPN